MRNLLTCSSISSNNEFYFLIHISDDNLKGEVGSFYRLLDQFIISYDVANIVSFHFWFLITSQSI
jgi:hypothetical protein